MTYWYTGTLQIPVGSIVHRFSNGRLLYEKDIFLYIEDGIVLNHEVKYNQRIPRDQKDNILYSMSTAQKIFRIWFYLYCNKKGARCLSNSFFVCRDDKI